MVYTNPVDEGLASGQHYDELGQHYLSSEKVQSDYADVRFERELRVFREHCPKGKVLDVGCSSGGFLFQVKKRFSADYVVSGIDVSGAPIEHAARMGVSVIKGDFLHHDFESGFDAVTFWAVMEHLFDPAAFLKRALHVLKDGGLCFVLVPNLSSMAIRILGAKYRYIYNEHLNYFSRSTLTRFISNGFEPVRLVSTHFNPFVIWQDWWNRGDEVPMQDRAKLLKTTTGLKSSRLMRPLEAAYSATERGLSLFMLADNLLMVGRKPQTRLR
jgi:2-polyprenyl-3-methyl-5-hydroxy-6-metoxy-1,4-benzoquinol methylase